MTQLAEGHEPLRLADGSLVFPDGTVKTPKQMEREQQRDHPLVAVPSVTEAQRAVAKANRKIAELPALPKAMNAVSVILTYTLFGLADEEIALATGLNVDQVNRIRISDAYVSLKKDIIESIKREDEGSIRNMIAQHAEQAVQAVVNELDNEDNAIARLTAAKDILDRSGHRPADVVEHRMMGESTLRIEFIKKDQSSKMPTLELEDMDNGDGS